MTDIDPEFVKWTCLDCEWTGSRHETDSSFAFSVLCPKCGSHNVRKAEMTDIDRNREVAEALGICWHKFKWTKMDAFIGLNRCQICGEEVWDDETKRYKRPDFSTDAGVVQLLRLMMERDDRDAFIFRIGYLGLGNNYVRVDYITTPGSKLLEAVHEWLKEKGVIR